MCNAPVVSVTDDLIAELDDLAHCGPEELQISAWTMAALLAERAELLRDAKRYRWLQKASPYMHKKIRDLAITDGGDVFYFHKDKYDAAIDAAIQSEAKP